jgi:hypothetical protein
MVNGGAHDAWSKQHEGQSSLSDTTKGVLLAVSSSVFIGSSFVIKKHALRKVTGRKASVIRLAV